jgi:hypothetical protein
MRAAVYLLSLLVALCGAKNYQDYYNDPSVGSWIADLGRMVPKILAVAEDVLPPEDIAELRAAVHPTPYIDLGGSCDQCQVQGLISVYMAPYNIMEL